MEHNSEGYAELIGLEKVSDKWQEGNATMKVYCHFAMVEPTLLRWLNGPVGLSLFWQDRPSIV